MVVAQQLPSSSPTYNFPLFRDLIVAPGQGLWVESHSAVEKPEL